MPSGERYRVTLDNIKYDMSLAQFNMLGIQSLKYNLPLPWGTEQRIERLVEHKLFVRGKKTQNTINYRRTNLGVLVLNAINDRIKNQNNF